MNPICEAIRNQAVVTFEYDGSRRVVEPYVLGVYRDGDEMLHTWQRSGGSGSGWRDFETAKIHSFALTGQSFRRPHAGYNPSGKPYVRITCCLEPVG
ncbi:MAG TPA: WYL domain-containing protein [Alphaproteobacteria bacterium]|nr:WYL domain-containing protein [Alphaproteobacteria bacterium]